MTINKLFEKEIGDLIEGDLAKSLRMTDYRVFQKDEKSIELIKHKNTGSVIGMSDFLLDVPYIDSTTYLRNETSHSMEYHCNGNAIRTEEGKMPIHINPSESIEEKYKERVNFLNKFEK